MGAESGGTLDASTLFGAMAEDYARYRLTYPEVFFAGFADRLPGGEEATVWDCGCGNGQASVALAACVREVIATDASAEQIARAFPHPRVRYRRAPATASGLPDASVDGVVVAAAVHWFAGDAFNREVRRVCRPGGAMAWIGYLPPRLEMPELQVRLDQLYFESLEPWWPPERRWVDASYRGLPFPGEEWPFPDDLWIERSWALAELLGCIGTWSAVQRARTSGEDPLPALATTLAEMWPDGGRAALPVRWPFMGRWGRVTEG